MSGGVKINSNITVTAAEELSDGFFKLLKLTFDQQKFDGSMMRSVSREVLIRKPVVFLSLYDQKNDKILFVGQHRVGAIASCRQLTFVGEPIAGIIDDGETAIEAAVRECKEEAGLDVDISTLEIVHQGYTSAGGSSEYAYLVVGEFDSSCYTSGYYGVESENEDIKPILLSLKEAERVVTFNNDFMANSTMGALSVFMHKARLKTNANRG